MRSSYDVLIIGGGVIGTAIAARLSQTNLHVCLVEKARDVAEGASKGNAGGASSFYDPPGTLAAQLTTASYTRWEDICNRLNVPYKRIGGIMPAFNEEEEGLLFPVKEQAEACGIPVKLLTREQVFDLEPMISSTCRCALYFPADGIIDPMRLTCSYAELSARNGVDIKFNSPVIGFETNDSRVIAAITTQDIIHARYFVNAAGLYAGGISHLAGGENFRMWPRKGQYLLLDREFGAQINHIIYDITIPETGTKGIHVYPTTNRSVLLGPSSEDIEDYYDTSTDRETLIYILNRTKRMVPAISYDYVIKSFASLRPASDEPFFVRFDNIKSNLIHAVSRSIGVTTSPGIADYVFELLKKDGMEIVKNPNSSDHLPSIPRIGHMEDPTQVNLSELGKNFSQIICVCEQVTAGEIEAALTSRVPARSVDGVRKRTGATGGRCQGAVCMAGVAFLLSIHTNCPPENVQQKDDKEIGIAHDK